MFIRGRPFAIPSFHQKCLPPEKCRPRALHPRSPLVGVLPLSGEYAGLTSGVTDARAEGRTAKPGKLYLKTWPLLSL